MSFRATADGFFWDVLCGPAIPPPTLASHKEGDSGATQCGLGVRPVGLAPRDSNPTDGRSSYLRHRALFPLIFRASPLGAGGFFRSGARAGLGTFFAYLGTSSSGCAFTSLILISLSSIGLPSLPACSIEASLGWT